MFNIGDLVVYPPQGICRIDDICEKTFLGITKNYYVLHPIEDSKLTISAPVDNDKVVMLKLLNKEEAEEVLESFKLPGIDWIEANDERSKVYSNAVRTGNRKEIYMIANTLMKEQIASESSGKKFYEKDKRLLSSIQSTLFTELAFLLGTTFEAVEEKVIGYIKENEN